MAQPEGADPAAGLGVRRRPLQRPLAGLRRVAADAAAGLLGPPEAELGEVAGAGRQGEGDRQGVPGGAPAGIRAVAPVPRRRYELSAARRGDGAADVGVAGDLADGETEPGPQAGTALRAGAGGVAGLVGVPGLRRGGADEQSRRAGAAPGGVVAAALVRLSQCGRLSVRGADADGSAVAPPAEALGAGVPARDSPRPSLRHPDASTRRRGVNGYEL